MKRIVFLLLCACVVSPGRARPTTLPAQGSPAQTGPVGSKSAASKSATSPRNTATTAAGPASGDAVGSKNAAPGRSDKVAVEGNGAAAGKPTNGNTGRNGKTTQKH